MSTMKLAIGAALLAVCLGLATPARAYDGSGDLSSFWQDWAALIFGHGPSHMDPDHMGMGDGM